jgi:hypothetical protein
MSRGIHLCAGPSQFSLSLKAFDESSSLLEDEPAEHLKSKLPLVVFIIAPLLSNLWRRLLERMTSVMPLRLMIVVLICVELLQVVQCVDHDNIQRLRKKHKKGLDNGTLNKGDNTFLQNSIPNEAVAINEGLSDIGEFHIGGNPVAYEKCDDLLLRVSGDDDLVDESEYLDFLALVTGGEISAPTFDDLEGVFASIFLQAACTEGSSCDGETGSIFLEGTYVSNPIIFLFCTRVLQEVTTTTSLTFGYTIRYDTDIISKVRATHSPTVPPRDRSHPSFSHLYAISTGPAFRLPRSRNDQPTS